LPSTLEINSGKFEIIRALNFGEDFIFRDHPNPMRKRGEVLAHLEMFWFEHSGRFVVPPKLLLLFYSYD